MNLTIILIAAYLPLFPLLFLILRSRSFGKGSRRIFLKLLFLGILAAVPAFLMAAGALGAAAVIFRLFPENAEGTQSVLFSVLLRYVLAGALIEEAWKHFILRVSTWKQMTMETVGDGIAAAAVVGTAFSAVLYLAWQAAYHVLPPDLEILRSAMPDFLSAGPVAAFIHALLFIPSHFGYAGLMGVLYGFAKGSEQKKHSGRAGFMLTVSFLMAVLVHGVIESLVGYGFVTGQKLWLILGFAAEALLAFLMASALVAVRDSSIEAAFGQEEPEAPVEFADSEEFADFAEAEGNPDAAAGESSQQSLLEYADADVGSETGFSGTETETVAGQDGPEFGASDTEMETGSLATETETIAGHDGSDTAFSDTETETGSTDSSSDTEAETGGLLSGSDSWDRETEAESGSSYSPLEFGSADKGEETDKEEKTDSVDGFLTATGAGSPDEGTPLEAADDRSGADGQDSPNGPAANDSGTYDPEANAPETTDPAINVSEMQDSSGDSGYGAAAEPAGQEDPSRETGSFGSGENENEQAGGSGKGLFSKFRKMIDGDFS